MIMNARGRILGTRYCFKSDDKLRYHMIRYIKFPAYVLILHYTTIIMSLTMDEIATALAIKGVIPRSSRVSRHSRTNPMMNPTTKVVIH